MQHDSALARVVERVKDARLHGLPLEIRGAGTKRFYGETPRGDVLDVSGVTGISSYEPSELVVTVRGGTPLLDLEAALEECGQCLPFEPPRFSGGGTVAGMVAAGLSGPARASVGSVRDHLLGVTLLDGNGEILSFGGQVAKNVAGYDVSRLMAGALGILGVICEVSLKVMPKPPACETIVFDCSEREALSRFMSWAAQPLSINASAWHQGRLYIRLAGARAAVQAACDLLGGAALAEETATLWWDGVRDQTDPFFVLSDADLDEGQCLWRLSVPATAGPLTCSGQQFIAWNGAERWWRTCEDAGELRTAAIGIGGHATLVRGADKGGGVFTPLSEVLLKVHRNLKTAFDPAGIFNPGRMYSEL